MANKTKPRPWMNEDGTKKTDEEIRELGKNWSAETWKRFLDADTGTTKDESLVFFADMDKIFGFGLHDTADTAEEHGGYGNLESALILAMDGLSPKEREIIARSFWKGVDDGGIAEKMGMATGAVWTNKSRAIKKLGGILPSRRFKTKLRRMWESGRLEDAVLSRKRALGIG